MQIETNGLLYREIPKEIKVVCSPKNNEHGYRPIKPDLLKHVIAIKFLISANNHLYNDIAEIGQTKFNIPIYLQPMDEHDAELNIKNTDLTLKLTKKYNAILSLQLHKILKID